MHETSNSILLYGRDPLLLATRRWILESRGYRTVAVTQLEEFDQFTGTQFELLILCHSLDPESCANALGLAASCWPGIKTLVLARNVFKPNTAVPGQVVMALDGPLALISTLTNLVGAAAPTAHSHVH